MVLGDGSEISASRTGAERYLNWSRIRLGDGVGGEFVPNGLFRTMLRREIERLPDGPTTRWIVDGLKTTDRPSEIEDQSVSKFKAAMSIST